MWAMVTHYSVTSSRTMSLGMKSTPTDCLAHESMTLTNEIVKAEQRAGKFSIVLHDDPYARANASVDQFFGMSVCVTVQDFQMHTEREDLGRHVVRCRVGWGEPPTNLLNRNNSARSLRHGGPAKLVSSSKY